MGSLPDPTTTPGATPSILFITANAPSPAADASTWISKIEAYLHDPLAALRARGATVTLRTFQDAALTPSHIASTYTHILFLAADKYHEHIGPFTRFLTTTLPHAQRLNPALCAHNPPALVAWNANKTYLAELQAAPSATFRVPRTTFLAPECTGLAALQAHLASDPAVSPHKPLVLKPSIAASGLSTHLIKTPHALGADDEAALAQMRNSAPPGAQLMLQEFLPRILPPPPSSSSSSSSSGSSADAVADEHAGEWSLIMVSGRLTHCVRKRPRAGEFRINSAFKGVWEPMPATDPRVPACGREVAGKVWAWLEGKEKELKKGAGLNGADGAGELLYARVDGVVGEDGEFVLMEVELIEPWLWFLEDGPGREGLVEFCDAVCGKA